MEVYPPSAGEEGSGWLFLDDGESDCGNRFMLDAALRTEGQTLRIGLNRREQSFVPVQRDLDLILPSRFRTLSVDGEPRALGLAATVTAGRREGTESARRPLDASEVICT